MTSDTDVPGLVARALDQTDAIISVIPARQAGLATPCPAWDVQALVRHVVGQGLRNFLVSARGETPDWQLPADELGEDWAAEFRASAARLTDVWQAANLDRPVPMPGGGQTPLRGRADQQIAELVGRQLPVRGLAPGRDQEVAQALPDHVADERSHVPGRARRGQPRLAWPDGRDDGAGLVEGPRDQPQSAGVRSHVHHPLRPAGAITGAARACGSALDHDLAQVAA